MAHDKDDGPGRELPIALFISAGTPGSERARQTVEQALEQAGYTGDHLEIVDVRQEPQRALNEGAIAVPMLSARTPHGHRWFAGNFEDPRNLQSFIRSLV